MKAMSLGGSASGWKCEAALKRAGGDLGGGAPCVMAQSFLGALDRVERAELRDDDLVRTLVEGPAAGLASDHDQIVRPRPGRVVTHWFSQSQIFGLAKLVERWTSTKRAIRSAESGGDLWEKWV